MLPLALIPKDLQKNRTARERNQTMLFKPNFCSNCGVKIERADWGLLTSRRFCEVCAVEKKEHDWMPRVVVAASVLFGVFGLGAYMGGGTAQPQPGILAPGDGRVSGKFAVGADQPARIKDPERTEISPQAMSAKPAADVPGEPAGRDLSVSQPLVGGKSGSVETVIYCGALTKKGKPCSRRVKSRTRCWQHAGQPSALVTQEPPDVY